MSDQKLLPCPFCGINMKEFSDGNFGHPLEYRPGIESTCPIRGQLFDSSERRAWEARPLLNTSHNPVASVPNNEDKLVKFNEQEYNKAVKILELDILNRIRNNYPGMGQFYNHPEDVVNWTAKMLYLKFSRPASVLSVREIEKIIKDELGNHEVSEDIAKRIHARMMESK